MSPALPPGRTLSASDELWEIAPWSGVRPAFDGSNRELGDSYLVIQPFLQHSRASLPEIPLWNPYVMAGRPFLANSQSAVFSPFSLPAYLLPFWRSLALVAALKLVVAALGAYLLGGALGMRFAGAFLTGIVFAFSFWLVAWLSWPTASVWAFLPWLWLCVDRVARQPGLLQTCGLAVVVALQFLGGHPESSFHVLAASVVFFVLRRAQLRRDAFRSPTLGRAVSALAGGLLLGAGLAALTLIPLGELLGHSGDQARRHAFAQVHVPPRFLLGLFLHDFWGRETRVTTDLFAPILHTRAYYVGALTLMLATAAVALGRSVERVGLALIALACLAISVGARPFPDLLGLLPGFQVTNNSRLVIVFVLCAALLAGCGLDDLAESRTVRGRRLVPAIGLLLLIVPLVWMTIAGDRPWGSVLAASLRIAWAFDFPSGHVGSVPELQRLHAEIHTAALFEWLLPAAAGVALLAARISGRLRPAPFAALAIALLTIDLFKAGVGINPAIPVADAEQPVTPAIRHLRADLPNRFAGLAGNPLPANRSMRYGLLDVRGYDFPIDERYLTFWRHAVVDPTCNYHFCTTGVTTKPGALRALGLLSVRDLLARPTDEVLHDPNLQLEYEGPDGRIYTNRQAVARAFIVDRQQVVPDAATALAAVTSKSFDPTATAITEERVAGIPSSPVSRLESPSPGTARIVDYDNERVTLEADAPRQSLLVLTDTYAPGWKATVDSRRVPVHRVDYLLRGVQLDAGRHRVEFRYEPAGWRIGLAVSALSLVVLLALLAMGRTGSRPARDADT